MEKHFIQIFELIHRWGLDNSCWGFVSDTDTQTQFGVSEDIPYITLNGTWLYLYLPFDDIDTIRKFIDIYAPIHFFKVEDTNSYIMLYYTEIVQD